MIKDYHGPERRCEAVVGQRMNGKSPQLIGCKALATKVYVKDGSRYNVSALLCATCAEKIDKEG